MFRRAAFALLPFLAGCGASYATQYRDVQVARPHATPPEGSLIPADSAALSDGDIHRILEAKPTLPSRIRIAMFHLGHQSMDDRYGQNDPQQMIAISPRFVDTIRKSPIVIDASYLPAFLVSSAPTLGQLREAAARYQADVVLLFTTTCRLYPQYNLFVASKARAYCSADSAVLDVRTGLVPFVARGGSDVTLEESQEDYRLSETVQRVELDGMDRAMELNTEHLLRFLQNVADKQAEEPAAAASAP